MIAWLKGKVIQIWDLSSKKGVVIDVSGVGYEVQLLLKEISELNNSQELELWIHQIERDDSTSLFGFKDINKRDLFRKIINVNGIGPQIAMALLDDFNVNELVDAIENNEFNLLTKSQGIGKRIAERLVVELKNKLHQFSDNKNIYIDNENRKSSNILVKYIEEIKSILNSLGYLDNEIKHSLEIVIANDKENILRINSSSSNEKNDLMDKHLKEILISLSQIST